MGSDESLVFLKMVYSLDLDCKVSGYVEFEEFDIQKPLEVDAYNSESEDINMWSKIME